MRFIFGILPALCALALGAAQQGPAKGPSTPPSIGLDLGQKAPAFSALDQFGRQQTNETLRGSNGTVLLFFRSADW
jgi:hypothetical protein